jgi:hypothetical protein
MEEGKMREEKQIEYVRAGGTFYQLGNKGVNKIKYHSAQGEGDRHYCDIYYDNGTEIRAFNIEDIIWR